MNDIKELIREEIERRRHDYGKRMLQPDGMVARAKFDELTGILAFIDSLPEEKLSEDLEEAADEYADDNFEQWVEDDEIYSDADKIRETFIAGAKWMSKQINNE